MPELVEHAKNTTLCVKATAWGNGMVKYYDPVPFIVWSHCPVSFHKLVLMSVIQSTGMACTVKKDKARLAAAMKLYAMLAKCQLLDCF